MLLAFVLIITVSMFLAAAREDRMENILPCIFLMVVTILYPFYCLDLLRTGRIAVYIAAVLTVAGSVFWIRAKHSSLTGALAAVLSPGILVYAGLCLLVTIYTRNNLVGLWDELRLWGAVPKAMYMTESLQVGGDALVFPIMQSYPPGMPLLVYFMTKLSPVFRDGSIFAVYGMLYFALLLPALKNLKWKHWPVFLPLVVLSALIPCVLTSHGGDFGWFYESLFIDPILGALAGYTFYLAAAKPFASGFSFARFFAALLTLTIIKDSGAMFALVAAVWAVGLSCLGRERRSAWKMLPRLLLTAASVAIGYFLWKWVLAEYGVATNLDRYMSKRPPLSAIVALIKQLLSQPMVVLGEPLFHSNLTLTYVPCFLGIVILSAWFVHRREKEEKIHLWISWLSICFASGLFFLGYIISYHNAEPSFQRYASSTLMCMMVFALLHADVSLFENIGKRLRSPRAYALLLTALTLYGGITLALWREKKWDIEYAQKHAIPAIESIQNAVEGDPEDPANVYLLISDTPASYSMAHHRIYFELLGSSACVRNFWNNTNISGGNATPETWTPEELAQFADKWQANLRNGGYDYVCVVVTNDFTSAVLAQFGAPDAQVDDVYAIEFPDGQMQLRKVTAQPESNQ